MRTPKHLRKGDSWALMLMIVLLTGCPSDSKSGDGRGSAKPSPSGPPPIAASVNGGDTEAPKKTIQQGDEPQAAPQVQPPTIRARDLCARILAKWSAAQNAGDFDAYARFYAADFAGVKLTVSGRRTEFASRESWLDDRRGMFKSRFRVENMGVAWSEWKLQPGPAEGLCVFTQYWWSRRYSDLCDKTLRVRFADPLQGDGIILRETCTRAEKWKPSPRQRRKLEEDLESLLDPPIAVAGEPGRCDAEPGTAVAGRRKLTAGLTVRICSFSGGDPMLNGLHLSADLVGRGGKAIKWTLPGEGYDLDVAAVRILKQSDEHHVWLEVVEDHVNEDADVYQQKRTLRLGFEYADGLPGRNLSVRWQR